VIEVIHCDCKITANVNGGKSFIGSESCIFLMYELSKTIKARKPVFLIRSKEKMWRLFPLPQNLGLDTTQQLMLSTNGSSCGSAAI
jgi:hypothetical protein